MELAFSIALFLYGVYNMVFIFIVVGYYRKRQKEKDEENKYIHKNRCSNRKHKYTNL